MPEQILGLPDNATARVIFDSGKAAEKIYIQALDKRLELASGNIEHYLNILQFYRNFVTAETLNKRYGRLFRLFLGEDLARCLKRRIIQRIQAVLPTSDRKANVESDPEFRLLKRLLTISESRATYIRALINCYEAANSYRDALSYYLMLVDHELTQDEQYKELIIGLYLSDLEQGIAYVDCANRPIPIAKLDRARLYKILQGLARFSYSSAIFSRLQEKLIDDLIAYSICNESPAQQIESFAQLGEIHDFNKNLLSYYLNKVIELSQELVPALLQALVKPEIAEAWLDALLKCHQFGFEFSTLHPLYTQNPFFMTDPLGFVSKVCARLKERTLGHCNKIKLAADPEYQFLQQQAAADGELMQRTQLHCYYAVGQYNEALACYEVLAHANKLHPGDRYIGCQIKLYKPYLDQGTSLQEAVNKEIVVDKTAKQHLLKIYTDLHYLAVCNNQPGASPLAQKIAEALIDYHIQHIEQLGIEPLLQTYKKTVPHLSADYWLNVRHAVYQAIVKLAKTRDNPLAIQEDYEQLLASEKKFSDYVSSALAELKQPYVKELYEIFAEKVPAYIASLATYEEKLAYLDRLRTCSLFQLMPAGAAKLAEIRKQVVRAELDARCADVSICGVIGLGRFYQQVKAEVPSEYRDTVFHAAIRYILTLAHESSKPSSFQTLYDSYFVYIKETFSTESQIAYYLTQLQQYFLNKVVAYVRSSASRIEKFAYLKELLSYKIVKDKKSYIDLTKELKALQSQVEKQQVDERLLALDPRFNSLDPKVLYEACLAQVSNPNLREVLPVYEVLDKLGMQLATSTEQSLRERVHGLRQQMATMILADAVKEETDFMQMVELYDRLHTALTKENKERLGQAAIERILIQVEACSEPAQIESYYRYCQAFKQAIGEDWKASLHKLQWHFMATVEASLKTLTDKDAQCSFLKQVRKFTIVTDNTKQEFDLRDRLAVKSNRYHFHGQNSYQQASTVNDDLVSHITHDQL